MAAGGRAISTHAPARGATHRRRPRVPEAHISTHAPARGATRGVLAAGTGTRNFNPRSRTGSDDRLHVQAVTGADFNPRSRTGSDSRITGDGCWRSISTHAPARGATLPGYCSIRCPARFQPTLPHGERPEYDALTDEQRSISTHAPARGATRVPVRAHMARSISTHAPARGATA